MIAWVQFHALDFTAVMVLAGCAIAIHRRLNDRGAIAFNSSCSISFRICADCDLGFGLMLTASSLWLDGYMYSFIALSHQATGDHDAVLSAVRQTLSYRSAAGIDRRRALSGAVAGNGAGRLPALRNEFVGQMWLDDLKKVVDELGLRLSDGERPHAAGLLPALQAHHARAGLREPAAAETERCFPVARVQSAIRLQR